MIKMNAKGINYFLESVNVGDKLSVSFTEGNESQRYYGKVLNIGETKVALEGLETPDELFAGLEYPAMMVVNLSNIWAFSVTKKDGTQIYL
jgi:hypothetical protein